jgi:hypothetical protein
MAFAVPGFSQEESKVHAGVDLMSRYVWRGMNLGGSSPSIQPCLKFDFMSGNTYHSLSTGFWGAYTFSNTAGQEVDMFIVYSFKEFLSLTLTDYFAPGVDFSSEGGNFFNYDKDSTSHVLEGTISFNGTKKIPLTLLFAMNFYGNDARRMNSDGSSGKIFMSNYLEAGYKITISDIALNFFIGATLNKPDNEKGEVGYYGNTSAGVINLGLKASREIVITETFTVPVQASLSANPESGDIFFVFGFSF